jgi:hypothetical protein
MGWEFFGCNVKNIEDVNKTRYSNYGHGNARRMTGVALTSDYAYSDISDKQEKGVPFVKAHYPDTAISFAVNSFTKKLQTRISLLTEEHNALEFSALEFVIKTKTKTCKCCSARVSTDHYKNIAAHVAKLNQKSIGWVVSCTNCKEQDGIASSAHTTKRVALRAKRLQLEATLHAEQARLLAKLLEKKKIKLEYTFGVWLHESDAAILNGEGYGGDSSDYDM